MEVYSLQLEGSNLILNGKVMDVMMISIYLRPEDIWKVKDLLSWSIIWHFPFMLAKGLQMMPNVRDSDLTYDPSSWTHLWSL